MRRLALLLATTVSLSLSCKNGDEPPPPPPPPECGNGLLETGESCEGLPPPMGCDPVTCTVLPDYGCVPEIDTSEGETGGEYEPQEVMSTCMLLDTCGDGVVDPGEQCDDGDETIMDGCSGCVIDPQWECVGEPSECFKCGDGFLDPGEECDDGEDIGQNTPGCEQCVIQPGWNCFEMPPPSLCVPICGDGIWLKDNLGPNVAEGCDDGNLEPGDGCNAACDVEEDCECTGPDMGVSTCVCGLGTTGTTGGTDSGSDSGSDSGTDSGTTGGTTTGGAATTGATTVGP